MISFFVLLHDFNTNRPEKYDIMPYLMQTYKECKEKDHWWPMDSMKVPETLADFRMFVHHACRNRFWARCEYEWLMIGWPYGKTDTKEDCLKIIHSSHKIDAFDQIEMNLVVITQVFMANLGITE